jgi:ABC-type polysaccharide/polyol phosphate transport system ATPase subunit
MIAEGPQQARQDRESALERESVFNCSAPAERLVTADCVSKKYCRDFRKSLRYALVDVARGIFPPRDLSVLREDEFWAVKDVSFVLRRGDSLGLIGHNGAGKSTLLKMLTGQRTPTAGSIVTRGRVVALAELGLGFDPVLTGRENAYVNASVLGVPRGKLKPVINAIIDFAGLREFIDSSVQTYSSGMKARLGFAVAAHLNPDILLVDEVLAVGDLNFRCKCVKHMLGFLRGGGSMIVVAHDPSLIQVICNRCLAMEKGRVIFDGPVTEGLDLNFQMGHAATLQSVAGKREMESKDVSEGQSEGQTAEQNWLTAQPSAVCQRQPTAEQPIVVDRIEVTPQATPLLVAGCPAVVTLRCRSLIEAELGWGFTICTTDLLTSISTCVTGQEGGGASIQLGENSFSCRLPKLPLRPGVYAIRGVVFDASTFLAVSHLGYQDTPVFFTVLPDRVSRAGNLQSQQKDLVTLEVEWLD